MMSHVSLWRFQTMLDDEERKGLGMSNSSWKLEETFPSTDRQHLLHQGSNQLSLLRHTGTSLPLPLARYSCISSSAFIALLQHRYPLTSSTFCSTATSVLPTGTLTCRVVTATSFLIGWLVHHEEGGNIATI